MRTYFVAALAAMGGVAVWGLSPSFMMVEEPGPAQTSSAVELIDPAVFTNGLCSGRRKSVERRAFFFRLASAQAAAAGRGKLDLPPIYEGLGDFSYEITTTHPQAQAYFDQGLKLAYAFNHEEARRAFRAARVFDERCAMCFWGEALVLGPNINAPMENDAIRPAYYFALRAGGFVNKITPQERGLIEALETRYSSELPEVRTPLDSAYSKAMQALAQEFPEDDHILTLTAEAIMDTQPWDYWTAAGEPKGDAATALELLETVLRRNPDHIGAIHLYIHLTEAKKPELAEPYADRLAALAPAAGHLVHMPSHTYARVGRFKDSLETNRLAVEADEAFLAQGDASVIYKYGYYTHNVHFLMTSAQMIGDTRNGLDGAAKLKTILPEDRVAQLPAWVQPIAAAPYLAHGQLGESEDVLDLDRPSRDMPYVVAHWHYARALAYIRKSRFGRAEDEADDIQELREGEAIQAIRDIPAADVLEIAELVIRGKIAWVQNDLDKALILLDRAAQIQDELPYLEPPFWYYPVRQTLGGALISADRLEEAEQAFRMSLVEVPGNAWSLFGLLKVYERMGNEEAAAHLRTRFEAVWSGTAEPDLFAL